MAELKMPRKGGAAAMLQELNAAEAPTVEEPNSPSNNLTSNVVSQLDGELYNNITNTLESQTGGNTTDMSDDKLVRQSVRKSDGKKVGEFADPPTTAPAGKSAKRKAGETVAKNLGKGQMIAVGIKMPEDLSDYLDTAAFARRKQKVLKQDLIRRAIQLLVVELESGEELADLNS